MLLRDSLLYIVAKVLPGAIGVATTAMLTHLLDPSHYGIYGFALIIMTFGATMAFDWIGLAFMRLYETRRDSPQTIPTFIMMFIAVLMLTLVLGTIAGMSGMIPPTDRLIWGVGVVMAWAFSFFELIARVEISNFRPYRYLAMNLTRAALMLSFTGGAAWLTHDPVATALATALSLTIAALAFGGKRLRLRRSQLDRQLAREMIAFGLPYAVSMTMSALLTTGVRSLVGILDGTAVLGLYTAAFSLSQNTLALIAAGVGTATYPLAVRALEAGNPAATRRQLEANGTMVMGIMAPASLGLALIAPEVASVLVGVHFRAAVTQLMPWLAAAAFFAAMRAVYLDHAFQLGKRPLRQVWVTAAAAAIALGGTALLLPRVGAVGAAMATTAAMLFGCLAAWVAGWAAHPMPLPVKAWLRVLGCSSAMAVAVLVVPHGRLAALVIKLTAGGAAYAAAALALDVMDMRAALRKVVAVARRRSAAPLVQEG